MIAEIIIVGEEILSGQTVDSNSAYIARRLSDIGIEVVSKTTVGDRHEDIKKSILNAWNRSPVTIMTGGLGPTKDDTTKAAICEAFGRRLVHNARVMEKLEQLFRFRQSKMPELSKTQALQPEGAELFDNPVGTAPGIVFQDTKRFFVALPGVPAEMEAIMNESVIPRLQSLPGRKHIVIRRIRTVGITETGIAEKIADLEPESIGLRLAYLPSYRGVDLRVTAISEQEREAVASAEDLTNKIRNRISDFVFTIGDQSLAEMVGDLLKSKDKTLATAESCTGGLIAKMLTDIPGSSEYFVGSVVAYSNEIKEKVLGVSHELLLSRGAVSREVAESMAVGVMNLTGADYALSVTGIAGPGGATEDKPVGLVFVGYADKTGRISAVELKLFGTRERIRDRSAMKALDILRRNLS